MRGLGRSEDSGNGLGIETAVYQCAILKGRDCEGNEWVRGHWKDCRAGRSSGLRRVIADEELPEEVCRMSNVIAVVSPGTDGR